MSQPVTNDLPLNRLAGMSDMGFAAGIVLILAVLFLPLPPLLIDAGLAFSIAAAVLILMVALWVKRPLEFSSFPTILLIVTMLRLAFNVATTRIILTDGAHGEHARGLRHCRFRQARHGR